jgi:hypothetical protein
LKEQFGLEMKCSNKTKVGRETEAKEGAKYSAQHGQPGIVVVERLGRRYSQSGGTGYYVGRHVLSAEPEGLAGPLGFSPDALSSSQPLCVPAA